MQNFAEIARLRRLIAIEGLAQKERNRIARSNGQHCIVT